MDLSDRILKFNILSDNKIGQGLKMKKVSEILKKYKVAVIFAGFAVVFAGICIFCAVNLFSKPEIPDSLWLFLTEWEAEKLQRMTAQR